MTKNQTIYLEKVRFSRYVYDQIMEGNFEHYDATKLSRFYEGCVRTNVFSLYCSYKWFGLKKTTYLSRIDTDSDNYRRYIRIDLSPEEEELLWSVWPKVEEILNDRRSEETRKHLEYKERMSWWP